MTHPVTPPLTWDIFFRVIDNFGDIGVCWRLAADLASRGHAVRLWADDASALAWMAPGGRGGVNVLAWDDAARTEPADVVIEAFGCDPPSRFVEHMAACVPPPAWINLEHLSAEADVERSHALPSPQLRGPGAGLTKWFFYPGFTPRTGGLIRESGLASRQQHFDAPAFLNRLGLDPQPQERLVSLFCYDSADLPALMPALLQALADRPTLLLTAPGAATQQAARALADMSTSAALRVAPLPYLSQHDFDHLLWRCDLNFVRGEDSFVRAQWAGKPFVWQAYPQHDSVHAIKLEAFLDRFLAHADAELATSLRALWRAWNGTAAKAQAQPGVQLPDLSKWQAACESWRAELQNQTDLATQLIGFAVERR